MSCRSQFGYLDQMRRELLEERPDLDVVFHGVNETPEAASIELVFEEGSFAVLQDDETASVWNRWGADWRDVTLLDPLNEAVYTYNTAVYPLDDPDVYAAVKAAVIAVAEGRPPPPGGPLRLRTAE